MKRERLIKNLDILIVQKFTHKKNKELLEQKFKELNFKKEFSEDKINFGFNGYSKKIDSLDNLMHSLNDLFEDIIFFNEDDKVILFYPKTEKNNLNTSLKKIELLKNGKNNITNYISISGNGTRVNRF